MISDKTIEEVTQRLVKLYNPVEIYLFGSYAYGVPNEDSDLDLVPLLKNAKRSHQMLVDGHRALGGFYTCKDLLIFTKDEFARFSQDKTRLSYIIKNQGKQLYAQSSDLVTHQ